MNRFSLCLGFSVILAAGAWAWPAAATNGGATRAAIQSAEELQAISGRIASARERAFTIVVSNDVPTAGQSFQERRRHNMTFLMDSNTTVDGKLVVGAPAQVAFRVDNGNNIAVTVHVEP